MDPGNDQYFVIGTTTYTFTPAAGQCAIATSIDITIDAQITPVFTAIGPLCIGATAPLLPAVSNNGITGTWNPATINTLLPVQLLIHLHRLLVSVLLQLLQ